MRVHVLTSTVKLLVSGTVHNLYIDVIWGSVSKSHSSIFIVKLCLYVHLFIQSRHTQHEYEIHDILHSLLCIEQEIFQFHRGRSLTSHTVAGEGEAGLELEELPHTTRYMYFTHACHTVLCIPLVNPLG